MNAGEWILFMIFVFPWTVLPVIYFIGAWLFGWGKDDPELNGQANRWKIGQGEPPGFL